MCQRITCRTCGRPTYTGCGMHIEEVLGDVPPEQRCRCREERAERAAKARAEGRPERGGWLRRLIGR